MRAIHVDKRQQKGKHDLKHNALREMGATLVSHSLDVGDYAQAPKCSVDTKRDIYELAACITTQHKRFADECERAKEQGTLLVILTENDQGIANLGDLSRWVEPDDAFEVRCIKSGGTVKKRLVGSTLAKACETMHVDYGVLFAFCRYDETAQRIYRILDWGENIGFD